LKKSHQEAGLIFKTVEDALQPAPQHGGAASDDETLYALDVFSAAVTEKFRRLDRENIALRAKLDVVLTLLGQKSFKVDDMIDLPNWRRRDVA
jgi:hypothetical protein